MLLGNAAGALTTVRRECSDVDQALHIGLVAGFGDHRAPVGVPDQHHRAIDLADHPARPLGVVDQRGQRQLDRLHLVVALAVQFQDHLGPVCGPAPEPMDEEDGRCGAHALISGSGRAECRPSGYSPPMALINGDASGPLQSYASPDVIHGTCRWLLKTFS
ncbi:hypothetical protein D3C73_991640 [compost metagenome]